MFQRFKSSPHRQLAFNIKFKKVLIDELKRRKKTSFNEALKTVGAAIYKLMEQEDCISYDNILNEIGLNWNLMSADESTEFRKKMRILEDNMWVYNNPKKYGCYLLTEEGLKKVKLALRNELISMIEKKWREIYPDLVLTKRLTIRAIENGDVDENNIDGWILNISKGF